MVWLSRRNFKRRGIAVFYLGETVEYKLGDIIYFEMPSYEEALFIYEFGKPSNNPQKFKNISKIIKMENNKLVMETLWEEPSDYPLDIWNFFINLTDVYEIKKLTKEETLKYLI